MPAPGGVEHQLADRDGHAARALVAQAQDAFVVRHDDQPDVPLPEIAQPLGDLARGRSGTGTSPAAGGKCG